MSPRSLSSSTSIATSTSLLLGLLLLFVPTLAQLSAASRESILSSGKGLRGVMEQSSGAIARLHKTVSKVKNDLGQGDAEARALLSDCEELSSDSQGAVMESVGILLRINGSNGVAIDHHQNNNSNSSSSEVEEMVDLMRTNLSAALTDITTCTDGLHDELQDESQLSSKALRRIDKEARRASLLISKALSITANSSG